MLFRMLFVFAGVVVDGADRGRGWRGRRVGRAGWVLGAVLAVVGVMLAMSVSASAADCSLADFSYNGACGPEFESPAWGDTAGWTDPSKYSTIKLADITGNGTDELIARNDDGLEIWTFDTTVGQWRPAIGANGLPEVLRDLRSPGPTGDVRGSWRDPAAFSTIQTADLQGDGEQELIADGPNGTQVWRYTPPAGTKSINGGTWSLFSTDNNPVPASAPSQYLSLHALAPAGGVASLTEQNSYWAWDPNGHNFFYAANGTLAPNSTEPQYYLDNMSGLMPVLQGASKTPVLVPANVYRTPNGVAVQTPKPFLAGWSQLGPPPGQGGSPFPDASGFGSNPAYYETMRLTNHLLGRNDTGGYVLGRLGDGLHVYDLGPRYPNWEAAGLPVLADLKDPPNGFPPPGEWSSIRTGDVTGDGQTDVLALVNGQLRAWELELNGSEFAWTELPATVTLNLGGSMWENNASYYSTIQVGPVAGPGYPDAVIARGPFGIRTWFYCTGGASSVPGCASLQGQSGWTSWLPQNISSFPQFSGGQAAAWTELNTLARQANLIGPASTSTVRDAWTGTTAPTDSDLSNLENGVLVFAGCTGETSANPPTYSSCAVPSGGSGFTATDWTSVVNETLAEIYDASQTNDFFAQLAGLNSDTFLAKEAELPAIGDSVAALGQAAGDNSSEVSPQAIWAAGLGIAGAAAGILAPELGAALGIASYLAGIVPSATSDVNGPSFNATLNQLQDDLATAVSDAAKAVDTQSYEVRQNYGMLRLIAQLTGPSGPWHAVNAAGLRGSMEEGFALWAYKQLLPTVLERDVISNCDGNGSHDGSSNDWVVCDVSSFNGSVGGPPNFTYLNSPHTVGQAVTNSWPCWGFFTFICHYEHPPTDTVNGVPGSDIATKVWGPLSDTCNFNGDPQTEWTFDCDLGINPLLSTDAVGGPANGWNFTTCTGQPMLYFPGTSTGTVGSCSSSTSSQVSTGSNGSVKLTARVGLPAGFKLRTATLSASRLLYEPRGRGILLTRSSGASLGTVRLTVAGGELRGGGGGTMLGSSRSEPPITLAVKRTPDRLPQLTLSLSRLSVAVPYACQQLPASVSLGTQPFTLETSLKLSNGRDTQTLSLPAQWTCVRNRGGTVTGLRTVAPPSPAQHPGLTLSVKGPRRVTPGSHATYTVRVRNTRRGPSNPYISSLWHILVHAGLSPVTVQKKPTRRAPQPVTLRLAQLRRGETKVLRIRIAIPGRVLLPASVHRICVAFGAIADSARPAGAQACSAT